MTLGVVIVTHRSDERVRPLLADLRTHEPAVDVVLVDSGSPDGPPAVPPSIDVIAIPENVGYGTAANRGARHLLEHGNRVIAILNPDIRLQAPSLSELMTELEGRRDVGVATAPLLDADGRRQAAAWGKPSALRAFWFGTGLELPRLRRVLGWVGLGPGGTSSATLVHEAVEVGGHVLGGAMVVRDVCWQELDGFDEDFFLYWEDADLCERARRLGWAVAVLPATPIVHDSGTSSAGVTDAQRWQWYVDGADIYGRKHLGPVRRRLILAALRLGKRIGRRH